MKGDEGRGVATIRSGEVPSNLRSEDVRMRKLSRKKFLESRAIGMQTPGSETSQYREEKKPISISLVAASEREKAQTQGTRFWMRQQCRAQGLVHLGGYKAVIVL